MKACKKNLCIYFITLEFIGGLKIWECTKDLIDFIIREQVYLNAKDVVDLGCGAGIVGIYSLLNGARVHFQDYVSIILLKHQCLIYNLLIEF